MARVAPKARMSAHILCSRVRSGCAPCAPAAEACNLRSAHRRQSFAKESLDRCAVLEGEGADAERWRDGGDEAAEAGGVERPDFDLDRSGAFRCTDEPGFFGC